MVPAFNSTDLERLRSLLNVPKRVAVITHHRPDGDAMGSSLALGLYLANVGHQVSVITPSDYPDFLNWMPGQYLVTSYDQDPKSAMNILTGADIIFCLDFNTPYRVEKLAETLVSSPAFKVLVDHHLDPDGFCDITFSFSGSCATSELVYHLIVGLSSMEQLTSGISSCLYTGIMTDTGSFRFSSMSADTHRIIATLIERGVTNHEVHENVYDNFSIDRTRFLGYCINEKLHVLAEYKAAYIAITDEELERFNHIPGDTEGIVNFALGIKGIRLAAFFCERDGLVKISFRSKGDFSVKELASLHFSGGGHANASGGKSHEGIQSAVQKFLDILPSYCERLNS